MKVNLFKDVSRELEPIRNKIVRRRRLPFWTARITGIQNTFCKREVAGHWRRPHLNWSGQRSSITLQSMRTVLLYPNRSVLNGRLTRTGFQRKFPTQLLRTVRWKKLGLLRNTKIHHSTTCLKRGGVAGISFRRFVPISTIATTGISIYWNFKFPFEFRTFFEIFNRSCHCAWLWHQKRS